jgi:putative transposase
VLRAYKFRVYPDKEQEILFLKTFGCVRWYWNNALSDAKATYERTGKSHIEYPAFYKRQEQYAWLKEVDSYALCNSELHLATAYKHF